MLDTSHHKHVLEVYLLHDTRGMLYGVVCDDLHVQVFQDSANLMMQALSIQEDDVQVEEQWTLDEFSRYHGLRPSLAKRITGNPMLCLLQVVTATQGPHRGLRAVGIGSSQQKMTRASSIGLTVTAVRSWSRRRVETSPPQLQMLAVTKTVSLDEQSLPLSVLNPPSETREGPIVDISFQTSAQAWLEEAAASHERDKISRTVPTSSQDTEKAGSESDLYSPVVQPCAPPAATLPVPSLAVSQHASGAQAQKAVADNTAEGDLNVAKQRLIAFRRSQRDLTDYQKKAVLQLVKPSTGDSGAYAQQHFTGSDAYVIRDLRTVLDRDDYGISWVKEWMRCEGPFTEANRSLGKKRFDANYRWYFGVAPPSRA